MQFVGLFDEITIETIYLIILYYSYITFFTQLITYIQLINLKKSGEINRKSKSLSDFRQYSLKQFFHLIHWGLHPNFTIQKWNFFVFTNQFVINLYILGN